MGLSERFRFFMLFSGLIFLVNLFIMNEVAPIWEGAEGQLLLNYSKDLNSPVLELVFSSLFSESSNLFQVRLLAPILLCLTFLAYFLIGGKILGRENVLVTLLILAASFFLPNLSKRATADIWLFAMQVLSYIALLRYLKQPQRLWQIIFFSAFALSLMLHGLSGMIFTISLFGLLYAFHPQGKRLVGILPWLSFGALIPLLLSFFTNWSLFSADYKDIFELGWQTGNWQKYLIWSFLGFLPFFGFLLGGLKESIVKARKGEELSIINLSLGLSALLAQSLVLQLFFAILVAKQMQSYFVKNYPNKNIVKTGAILHIFLADFLVRLDC